MNDKTEDQAGQVESSDSGAGDVAASVDQAPVDHQAADREVASSGLPAPTVAPARRSSGIGVLALLIALAAAAGSGYVWKEQQSQRILEARVAELGRDIDRRAADLDRVLTSVDELIRVDREIDTDLIGLTARVEGELALFEALPDRVARLEATVEKVPGISQKSRMAWLRSEAEYFLRVANAQLNLAGNVEVSLRALELADVQLRALADPALTPVREAISDERAALRAVPRPDAEGIVLTLGSIAQSLDSLPFAKTAPGSFRGAEDESADESGWQRAWRVIVDALKSIISVKRDDQEIVPLLMAAEEAMLIRSLDVDLQIARLAVIRSQGEVYRRSIDSVRDRLRTYFDVDATEVAAVLGTLDELAPAELPEELPDISGSLTLLLGMRGGDAA
jgi:uncharacterized protein HemX